MLIKTELKRNERVFETLENMIDKANCKLIKTFTNPSDGMIFDDIINEKDRANKEDNKKQQLDQNTQQNYNETSSKMLHGNNADLISEMITNNEIRDSLILEKIASQKQQESKQLAEKIQPDLDVYLRDDNETAELTKIDDSSFKRGRSKHLAELNQKSKPVAKIKKRSPKPHLKNKKSNIK